MKILASILEYGLLLVPEIVTYPPELRDPGDERDKIVNVQRRLSLTMLPDEQLVDHGKHFGPVSLGFSALAARRLGAMPVMYLPQATGNGSEAGLDQLGYFFSYRIAELHQLCDRIINLRKAIDRQKLSGLVTIKERSGIEEIEIDSRPLQTLLDMLVGPNNVEDLAAVLQALSSLFYPTDEFRHSVELVRSPLYYYFQREWRIISGLVLDGGEVDVPLTQHEKAAVSLCNPDFFEEVISLRHRRVRRVDACTIIRSPGGQPLREFVESIHVPAKWLQCTKDLLKKFSMAPHVRGLDIDVVDWEGGSPGDS